MKRTILEVISAVISIIIAFIVLRCHRAEWWLIGIYWMVVATRNTLTVLQGMKKH